MTNEQNSQRDSKCHWTEYVPFEYLNKVTNNKKLKEDKSYTDYLIEEGFIDKEHKPLICKRCGSKRFYNNKAIWTDADGSNKEKVEEIRCKSCDSGESAFYFNKWQIF